jgi:hypothetical protein
LADGGEESLDILRLLGILLLEDLCATRVYFRQVKGAVLGNIFSPVAVQNGEETDMVGSEIVLRHEIW